MVRTYRGENRALRLLYHVRGIQRAADTRFQHYPVHLLFSIEEERRRVKYLKLREFKTAALLRCVGDLVQEPRKVGAGDLVQPVGVAYRYALAYAADIGRGEFPRCESRRGKR